MADFPEARFHGEAGGEGDASAFASVGELTLRGVMHPFRMISDAIRLTGDVRIALQKNALAAGAAPCGALGQNCAGIPRPSGP